MMLPIGTVGRRDFRAYMTFAIIMVNVLFGLIELFVFAAGEKTVISFFNNFALASCRIGQEPVLFTVQKAIMTMFLHGSFMHLLGNMMFLWVFGPRVEEFFGHKRFLAIYLIVGLLASISHVLFGGVVCHIGMSFGTDMMIGASGAIAGVMGAFLFLYPASKIRTFVVFIFPSRKNGRWTIDLYRIFAIPAFVYLLFWVGMDIFNVMKPAITNVAHWAHIGGFFAGMALMFVVTMFVPAPAGNPLEHLDA
jgi:membrane associated rhomboid family serine protease